jgi:predicted nucleic acid-binding protein
LKLFLDTSSLVKLYHREDGTERLYGIIEKNEIEQFVLFDALQLSAMHEAAGRFGADQVLHETADGVLREVVGKEGLLSAD